jgi:hypothetical protein
MTSEIISITLNTSSDEGIVILSYSEYKLKRRINKSAVEEVVTLSGVEESKRKNKTN